MLQLLEALRFLHSNYVLHRDLKLSNLLYNQKGELKVADFGLARRVGGEYIVGSSGGRRRDKNIGGGNDTKQSTDPSTDHPHPSCCLTPKVVSLWYRPPELLLGAEYYDQGVDLWGAGCIMGELLRGKPIMDGKHELDQLQKMVRRFSKCVSCYLSYIKSMMPDCLLIVLHPSSSSFLGHQIVTTGRYVHELYCRPLSLCSTIESHSAPLIDTPLLVLIQSPC